MKRWMPTLPTSQISDAVVEEFLRAAHRESNTHEYKSTADTKRLAEVVSALANSYGGVVVIGVPDPWTGDISTLQDVDPSEDDRIVDQLVDVLDPSYWLPTLIPVIVDSHRLLVVHVDSNTAPRPLLVNGRAFVKRERRKKPASWLELQSLYAEDLPRAPAAPSLVARQLNTSDGNYAVPPEARTPADFTWRVVGGCPAWAHELRGRYTDARFRDLVKHELRSTGVDAWLRQFCDQYALDTDEEWHEASPSLAHVASFRLNGHRRHPTRTGLRASVHVQLDLAATPHGHGGGGIAATVDLQIWSTPLAEDRSIDETGSRQSSRLGNYLPRLDLSGIGRLLEALVDSSEHILRAAQHAIVDKPTAAFVGPAVWVRGSLDDLLDLSGASSRRPATNSLGNYRGFDPPDAFPTTPAECAQLVDRWLQVLLLTAGFVPDATVWPPVAATADHPTS